MYSLIELLITISMVIGAGAVLSAGLLGFFYVFRSSKEWPKNQRQLKSELIWQFLGAKALTEDIVMKLWYKDPAYPTLADESSHRNNGRVAVITGGNRGIGLHVVDKLLRCRYKVIMGVRDPKTMAETVKKAQHGKPLAVNNSNLTIEYLDIGSMESVKAFAKKLQEQYSEIHLLINNAGVMAAPFKLTEDGFESQLAINYLGHFLLTHLLFNQLRRGGSDDFKSRIVNVSSCVHVIGDIDFDDIHGLKYYYPADAYNQSKLAQVLFTRHLQKHCDSNGYPIQTHSVHPGVVDTDLFVHSSTTYIPSFKKLMFKDAEEGSRTIMYAAISPKIEGKGGSYLSNYRLAKMHPKAKDASYCERVFKFTCDMLDIESFGN